MALVNLFGIIAPCLNCCERLRYVKNKNKKKSKTKDKENIFDNKTNTTENIQVNDNVKEPFLQKDNNQLMELVQEKTKLELSEDSLLLKKRIG